LDFEGDVAEVYDRTFQIVYEYYGEHRTYDLKENGSNIMLTNENRQGTQSYIATLVTVLCVEYVDLYVKYLLVDSVQKQFDAFLKGYKAVCNGDAIAVSLFMLSCDAESDCVQLFRAEELELLITGSPVLDFEELEKSTRYDSGYSKDHPVIKFTSILQLLIDI
jgi:ubiquitin-protein ligase E3 A